MTTNRKLIRTVSNFIDLIQFHLICQKLAKFSGLNPKGPYLSKNRLSCLVPRRLSLDENFRIKEGEKEKRARRRSASHFLFPIVLCASSSVTRVSLAFSKNAAPEEDAGVSPKKTGMSTRKLLTGTDCSPEVKFWIRHCGQELLLDVL